MKHKATDVTSYHPTPISGSESQAMRGVAILCIMLHNILHLTLPTVENEFSFSYSRVEVFTDSISTNPSWALADAMSFLGWYGVAVFIFLSGYGLVRKYENDDSELPIWPFIKDRWLKVAKLILIPMLLFAIVWSLVKGRIFPIEMLLQQLSLIGNITAPLSITPGVYWFFGLIFQLYIVYRLFIYRRSKNFILNMNTIALVIYTAMWMFSDETTIAAVRHNCIGWILPFSIGAMFARHDFSALFSRKWAMWLTVLLSGVVLTLMNYNPALLYFSPIVAIVASIALAKLWPGGAWLGALSSSLFAMHPIVRYLLLTNGVKSMFGFDISNPYSVRIIPIVAIYIALSIAAAMLYKRLYTQLLDHK